MKEKFLKILNSNIFYTFIYAIFTLVIVLHHEIWADEAQVWQLVKNLSVVELFKHLVNEGHPAFFYLINMPFAKLENWGFSIFAMQFICWFASCMAVYLFLRFSPFNKWAKFAVVTSAGFLYCFPVIARSYSIIPLFVFALAILYKKSDKHPLWYAFLIFITANTHVIMFGFCAILALEFLYRNFIKDNFCFSSFRALAKNPKGMAIKKQVQGDNKKQNTKIIALGIMLLGLIAVVLQLHGTTSSNAFIKLDISQFMQNTFKVVSQFFINCIDNRYPELHSIMCPLFSIPAILISVFTYLSLFILLFLKDKKLFSIAFFSILFQLLIYIIGYNHWIFVTRIFCAHVILIFCIWILLENENISQRFKKGFNILLTTFFLLTFLNGLQYSILDYRYNYSSAKETAEYIIKNIDSKNSVIISDNSPYVISVVYYLHDKNKIFLAQADDYLKYVVWEEYLQHLLSPKNWRVYVDKFIDTKDKTIYAIIPFFNEIKLGIKDLESFELIYQSNPAIVRGEGFKIYKYIEK